MIPLSNTLLSTLFKYLGDTRRKKEGVARETMGLLTDKSLCHSFPVMWLISRYVILGATSGGAIADRLKHVDILY